MTDRDWLARLQEDQRRRWGQGERVPVEAYLEKYPALGEDPEAVLDLILGEVILREEAGEPLRLGDFLKRFPSLEEPLRVQFEVHQALQGDSFSGLAALSGDTRPCTVRTPFAIEVIDPARMTIPGYEIQDELGRGGMGVVYRARQVGLNRPVALKMILAGAHAGPNERARFRIEAEAVARLQHPNIVQVYEVGEWDGRPFLSLELVEGGLEEKLGGMPQPRREAARLAEILARAVHHVHQHGILHRDLKPSNILLTPEGVLKISDFGLAKLLDSNSGQTPSEALIGTPGYMAPEQASGHSRRISARSDVYALGAILYQCLIGSPPFRAETPLDTVRLVLVQEPVPPSRLQPRVSRDLETICLKCLEKEPEQRYPDAGALADDLARFLAGEPIRARPVSIGRRALKWARRRPTAAALVAVSLAAVCALIGIALWARHSAQRRLWEQQKEGTQLVSRAEAALARNNWTNAKAYLSEALARVGHEPALAELRARAERWRTEVDRRLDEEAARRNALARRQRFEAGRNEVLFRGTQPVDGDAPANLRATREAAEAALDAIGLSGPAAPEGALDPAFTKDEKEAILTEAYELFLVLADALAQPWLDETSDGRRSRLDEALQTLEHAARFRPPSRAYHLRRAQILAHLGKSADAEAEQAQAEAALPSGALDAFLTGVDRFMGGTDPPARAIADFEQALREQPDHFWSRYYLAVAHLNSGQPGGASVATSHLTACVSQRPDWIWTYLLRGAACGRLGQFAAAQADFRKAEQLHPNREALHALFINRGAVWYEEAKLDEADRDFTRAIALRPGHYQAHANLALLRKKQGRLDEALAQLDEALER
jgi:tetratricopeptide (TPR) repeat protein